MPYINKNAQDWILAGNEAETAGELAFQLTNYIKRFLAHHPPNPNFIDFAEVLGVLEAVKLELYRRMVGPYEDLKCKENGDVY